MSTFFHFSSIETIPEESFQNIRGNILKRKPVSQILGRNYPFAATKTPGVANEDEKITSDVPMPFSIPSLTALKSEKSEIPSSSKKVAVRTNSMSNVSSTQATLLDISEDFTIPNDSAKFTQTTSIKSSTSLLDDLFGSVVTPSTTNVTPTKRVPSFSSTTPSMNPDNWSTPSSATNTLSFFPSVPDNTEISSVTKTEIPPVEIILSLQETILSAEKAGHVMKYETSGKLSYQVQDPNQILSYPLKLSMSMIDPQKVLKDLQSNDFTFVTTKTSEQQTDLEFTMESTPSSAVEVITNSHYRMIETFRPPLFKAKHKLEGFGTDRIKIFLQIALNPHYSIPIQAFKVQVSLASLAQRLGNLGTVTILPLERFNGNYEETKRILTFAAKEVIIPSPEHKFLTLTAEIAIGTSNLVSAEIEEILSHGISLPILIKGRYETSLLSGIELSSCRSDAAVTLLPPTAFTIRKMTQLEFRFQ